MARPVITAPRITERIRNSEIGPSCAATKKPRPKPITNDVCIARGVLQSGANDTDGHQRVPGSVPGTSTVHRALTTARVGAWLGAWLAEYDGHQRRQRLRQHVWRLEGGQAVPDDHAPVLLTCCTHFSPCR